MVSTFTPNIQLEEPARGDDVGTWDTPVNNNMTLIDLVAGGITTISGAAGSLVLGAAQYQSKMITFNSTLIASIFVTFPTSFKKSYEIQNICTGSSAFTITLQTTASAVGAQAICVPPGEIVDIVNDGSNILFKNMGRVGEYMDIAGSSMPNWISGCTKPPYLNCDGSGFSSATYPALAARLGGTTLPDARGRARYALDQGVGRVSSAASGVAGNTLLAGGGDQLMQVHVHPNTLSDPGHTHGTNATAGNTTTGGGGFPAGLNSGATINNAFTGIGINNANAGAGGSQNMPPVLVAGLTLIRAG